MPCVPSSPAAGLRLQRPLKFTLSISRISAVNAVNNHSWGGTGGRCPPGLGSLTVSVGREQPPTRVSPSWPNLEHPWGPQAKPRLLTLPGGVLKESPLERRVPVPMSVFPGVGGAGEVSGWEIPGQGGGVSHAAGPVWGSVRGRPPLSSSNLPLLPLVASSLLPARPSGTELEKPLLALLRGMVPEGRLRSGGSAVSTEMGRPRGGTCGEHQAVRTVSPRGGKVCPELRARQGNPPVPRPFSDLYVCLPKLRATEKVGTRAERRRETQEGIPSGQRNSLRRTPFLLNILLPPNFLLSVTNLTHMKRSYWISTLLS